MKSKILMGLLLAFANVSFAGNSSSGGLKSYAFRCDSKMISRGGDQVTLNVFDISPQQDGSLYLAEVTIGELGKIVTSYTKIKRTSPSQFTSLGRELLKIDVQDFKTNRSVHAVQLQGKNVPFTGKGVIRFVVCDESDLLR